MYDFALYECVTYSFPTPAGGEASWRLPPVRKHVFEALAATGCTHPATRSFAVKLVTIS